MPCRTWMSRCGLGSCLEGQRGQRELSRLDCSLQGMSSDSKHSWLNTKSALFLGKRGTRMQRGPSLAGLGQAGCEGWVSDKEEPFPDGSCCAIGTLGWWIVPLEEFAFLHGLQRELGLVQNSLLSSIPGLWSVFCPSGDSGASAAVGSRAEQPCGDYKMIQLPLRKPSALLNSPVWERSWHSSIAGPWAEKLNLLKLLCWISLCWDLLSSSTVDKRENMLGFPSLAELEARTDIPRWALLSELSVNLKLLCNKTWFKALLFHLLELRF